MTRRRHRSTHRADAQRGSFLLEALVAILIVAFGIIGLLGLEARALQNVDDAQYRSEAVALANSYIGQMWTADQTTLSANFSDTAGVGTPYDEFKNVVGGRLPGASGGLVPRVTVTPAVAPTPGTQVTVTIMWNPPGGGTQALTAGQASTLGKVAHQYVATATVNSTN